MNIRQEEQKDYLQVTNVVEAAFAQLEESDQTEHLLISRLRKSSAFVPQLSLVAETDGMIQGHILFTKVKINSGQASHEALALAPVSVHPREQRKGIGSKLIEAGHEVAKSLGYESIVLLGHADYYPRFGYQKAADFGIALPFPVPEENCMVKDLVGSGLPGMKGVVEYPSVFFEE